MVEPIVIMPKTIWLLADENSGDKFAFETKDRAADFAVDPDHNYGNTELRWFSDEYAEWWQTDPWHRGDHSFGYLVEVKVI